MQIEDPNEKNRRMTTMKKLIEKIVETQHPTVVGLDSLRDYNPAHIKDEAFARCG